MFDAYASLQWQKKIVAVYNGKTGKRKSSRNVRNGGESWSQVVEKDSQREILGWTILYHEDVLSSNDKRITMLMKRLLLAPRESKIWFKTFVTLN